MKKTEIFFPFEPKAKGRPRFTRTGHAYTPNTTAEYEKQIREYYQENAGDYYDSAISVKLIFYMPIPKSLSKKKQALLSTGTVSYTKKPDLDNLIKSVTDSVNGIAFSDDSLITRISARKMYAQSQPGTYMEITEDVE